MNRAKKGKLPSVGALRRKYGALLNNPGLRRVRNWTLPNDADKTDEDAVHAGILKEDENAFLQVARRVIKAKDPR